MTIEIRYEGNTVALNPGETVLEGFERAGVAVQSSCRAGACQSCLMRAVDGPVPAKAQDGLKDSLRQSGHFLACLCRPEQALACEPAFAAAFRGPVTLEEVRLIGPDVARVRFRRPVDFTFVPGQFVTLRREDGLSRSYSIASQADDEAYVDLHVRLVPNGRMSGWLHGEAQTGTTLWAEGPKGDCMYYPGTPEEPLLLVGTGTGMAPLHAIALDALKQGHTGPVHLVQGGVAAERLYLVDELSALAALYPNVRYTRCLLQGPTGDGIVVGDLRQHVLADAGKTLRVYLCGDPPLVRDLKRHLFLRGVSLRRIHADPFVGT